MRGWVLLASLGGSGRWGDDGADVVIALRVEQSLRLVAERRRRWRSPFRGEECGGGCEGGTAMGARVVRAGRGTVFQGSLMLAELVEYPAERN